MELTEEQRQKRRDISARFYARHKERILRTAKLKRETDPRVRELARIAANKRNANNREHVNGIRRAHYYRHHEKSKAYALKRYYEKARNDPNRFERNRKYMNERYKNNPGFRVLVSCRTKLYTLLRRQGRKKSFSLKIEKDALVKHLESQWLPGMNWENHGKVWHIDHKIPCIEFDLTDPQQVAQCFSFENLRPLWAKDNLRKNRTVLPEFNHLLPKRNAPQA